MKLYTEEQVIDFTMNMIHQYEFGNKKIWWDKELLKESIQYVTPIELPSDKEIEKEALEWCLGTDENGYRNTGDDYDNHELPAFIEGAKWMRDKLTFNNKEK